MIRFIAILLALGFLAGPAFGYELPFEGFLEVAGAARVVSDDNAAADFLLSEARFQVDITQDADVGSFAFRADFVYDGVEGEALIDVREANILVTPVSSVDMKIGRQIATWGTGDLVFLNDLFPKDWQSFFIGRADEYLKKPSDALRGSWFGDTLNVDLVWSPIFTPDGYISGERLSYWNGMDKTGPVNPAIDPALPDKTFGNGELAGRVYANLAGWETALYGYRGRFGQPLGFDGTDSYFPKLESWGASVRGALLGGVANLEGSWYRSLDNKEGDDPFVPNSEVRLLVGYSREILSEQTLGLQFYWERLLDYDDDPLEGDNGPLERDEDRIWLTARYMGFFMQQNLITSLFVFYSPTDDDGYLRPKVTYKASDEVQFTVGMNIFAGAEENTFFGQFEDNTNLYARLRYSY